MREPVNKNEQNRIVAWRLKLLREASEMPRNVAQACRHFGLSRKTFYKWQARHRAHGEMSFAEWGKRASPQQVGKLDCCRTH
jgi:transposase-like protein